MPPHTPLNVAVVACTRVPCVQLADYGSAHVFRSGHTCAPCDVDCPDGKKFVCAHGWVAHTAGTVMFMPPEAQSGVTHALSPTFGHTHTHARTHAHTYAHAHTHTHIRARTHVRACADTVGGVVAENRFCAYCADMWALGVCLYSMLMSVLPFGNDATTAMDGSAAIMNDPYVPSALSRRSGCDMTRLFDCTVCCSAWVRCQRM